MNTWTVDPNEDWLELNQQWTLEANLPDTERCQFTLTGQRCELVAAHDSSHMIHTVNQQLQVEHPVAVPDRPDEPPIVEPEDEDEPSA